MSFFVSWLLTVIYSVHINMMSYTHTSHDCGSQPLAPCQWPCGGSSLLHACTYGTTVEVACFARSQHQSVYRQMWTDLLRVIYRLRVWIWQFTRSSWKNLSKFSTSGSIFEQLAQGCCSDWLIRVPVLPHFTLEVLLVAEIHTICSRGHCLLEHLVVIGVERICNVYSYDVSSACAGSGYC